jgi:hypothetical protein
MMGQDKKVSDGNSHKAQEFGTRVNLKKSKSKAQELQSVT